MNEVKLFENINNNDENFQVKIHMQKEVSPLCKLPDQATESLRSKERSSLTEKLQSQLSHLNLAHLKEKYIENFGRS